MGDGVRVLIAVPHAPYPPTHGFAIRVHHLARELVRLGDEVTLVAHADGADAEAGLARSGIRFVPVLEPGRRRRISARLRGLASRHSQQWHARHSRAMQVTIDELLAGERFDVVQIESPEFWTYRYPPGRPLVYDAHNIWGELRARMQREQPRTPSWLYRAYDTWKLAGDERRAWQRANLCVATSEREAAIMRAGGARRSIVVPNGVDLGYFRPAPYRPVPDRLVFMGVVRYRPNADAVRLLAREIVPEIARRRPAVELEVVGQNVPGHIAALGGRHVRFTGSVPDVRPHLADAAVAVIPLRTGSGTRLKALEAFAMARPVVSTSLGMEGIEAEPGRHYLRADDPAEFADAVARLLEDPGLAEELGRAGRALVEERYGWDAAGARLHAALTDVVARPG